MADQKLRVDIIGDASKLNRSLTSASSRLKSFGSQISGIGRRLAVGLTLPIGIAGGAAIKLASDFQESLNKVDVAFGSSSKNVKEFAKTTLTQFGIAQGSALDMAALFGDMSTSMGLSRSEAAELSTSLVGLAGDLASFKNMNIAEVTTALNGVFTGETESLKRLGVVMTQVNLEQFAMNQGITKSIKEMTQAEKVNLRFQFVMSKTANAHGDFARTQDGAANQMRIFQESLKELGSNIGQIILPAFTKIVNTGNNLLKFFKTLDTDTQTLIVTIAGLTAALPLVTMAIGSFTTVISALISPIGLVVAPLALLLFYFNEISNVINDFKITLSVGLVNTLVKVQGAFEKFMVRVETAVNVMNAFLKDGFDADFDSIFQEQADKISDITNRTGEEIQKNLDASNLLKQYNDLPPTLETVLDLFRKIGDRIGFGASVSVDSSGLPGANELSDIFAIGEGAFKDPLKPLATSNSFQKIQENLEATNKAIKLMDEERLQSLQEKAQAVGSAAAGAFQNFASAAVNAMGLADTGIQGFLKVLFKTVTDLIAMSLSASIAQAIMGATTSGTSTGPAAVFTTPAFIATAVGGVLSAFAAIPKFANGGIISGATLGIMGEYPGSRSNPEVVAPLDKLRGMIGQQTQTVNIGGEFRVEGQDLVLAIQRAEKNRNRLL